MVDVELLLQAPACLKQPICPLLRDRAHLPFTFRDGRGLLARVFSQATGARMARRLLAAGDAESERIEQDIHDGVRSN